MAQNKPATGTYHRLENTDDTQEMQPMAAATPQAQTQPTPQPPPYLGYVQVPPTAAGFQQASNNNVVVATQPTAMPAVTVVDPRLKPRPTVMIVTIVLTAVCLVQQCWPALFCLAPALIAAVVGYSLSDSGSAEQRHTARAFHAVAVCCNVATVVYYILALIALVVTLGTIFGIQSSYNSEYDGYYGGCYDTCGYDDYGNYNCDQQICYN